MKKPDTFKLFELIKAEFKSQFKWDVNYMQIAILNKCVNNDGVVLEKENHNSCAGSWTKNKIIYIGDDEHLERVKKYYQAEVEKFKELIMAHELAHEVYKNIATYKEKAIFEQLIRQTKFTTPYLESLGKSYAKLAEEQFCEYVAAQIVKSF